LGTKEWIDENGAIAGKYFKGPLLEITVPELEKISALTTPNQVLGVFKKAADTTFIATGQVNLMLDSIQDPGNLGTIIRIADWFGIGSIICSNHCADIYNPKVVQSTMGSLGRVGIVYTDLLDWIHHHPEVKLFATSLGGKNLYSFNKISSGVIVIGNESKGVQDEILGLAYEQVTIPKYGQAESLNVAVATGIVLSHLL
jgi:TrmH family RNA methyltransferase